MLILDEKEKQAVKDLQTQEKTCIEKYGKYSNEAKDPVLKDLFNTLKEKEQEHYDSLGQVLSGTVPACNCNDNAGRDYSPHATYGIGNESQDKDSDCYLATDCIGTEKLVSHEYDNNVFVCSDTDLRKLFADIQTEEQNHAEMLYKYKTANGMS